MELINSLKKGKTKGKKRKKMERVHKSACWEFSHYTNMRAGTFIKYARVNIFIGLCVKMLAIFLLLKLERSILISIKQNPCISNTLVNKMENDAFVPLSCFQQYSVKTYEHVNVVHTPHPPCSCYNF